TRASIKPSACSCMSRLSHAGLLSASVCRTKQGSPSSPGTGSLRWLVEFHMPVIVLRRAVNLAGLSKSGGDFSNLPMVRRKMADWVGIPRIARQGEGLAAAAAKVDLPARAGTARLAHPLKPPEGVEGRRVRPNV